MMFLKDSELIYTRKLAKKIEEENRVLKMSLANAQEMNRDQVAARSHEAKKYDANIRALSDSIDDLCSTIQAKDKEIMYLKEYVKNLERSVIYSKQIVEMMDDVLSYPVDLLPKEE